MIQANELRIGDIVQSKTGVWLTVIQISPGSIMYDRFDMKAVAGTCGIGEIFPIKLNSEVLETSGFARAELSRIYMKTIAHEGTDYPCTLQINFGEGIQICRSGIGTLYAPVTSLHQLQNLFFALTGTELTINLEKVKV